LSAARSETAVQARLKNPAEWLPAGLNQRSV
jgi:hypothetical protein